MKAAVGSTRRRRSGSGFTLIELMFSLVVGSIALTAIYTVIGGSTRVFHEQHRLSGMQTSLRNAMTRVTRDIQRAGYLSTPAANADDDSCEKPDTSGRGVGLPLRDIYLDGTHFAAIANWTELSPPGLYAAANDVLEPNYAGAAVPGLGTRMDSLTLLANYETSSQYAGTSLIPGLTNRITIEPTWHAFENDFTTWAGDPTTPVIVDIDAFREAFRVGRAMRLQTVSGKKHFAVISAVDPAGGACMNSGTEPWRPLCITFEPAVPNDCQAEARGSAFSAPISFMKYHLEKAIPIGPDVALEQEVTGLNIQLKRTEMSPVEPDVVFQAGSQTVILDYASMFNVQFIGNTQHGQDLPDVVNRTVLMNPMNPGERPEWVRSVIVEMATRSPIQDPRFPWPSAGTPDPVSRFLVHEDGRAGSARVRYARAEVFTPNIAIGGH